MRQKWAKLQQRQCRCAWVRDLVSILCFQEVWCNHVHYGIRSDHYHTKARNSKGNPGHFLLQQQLDEWLDSFTVLLPSPRRTALNRTAPRRTRLATRIIAEEGSVCAVQSAGEVIYIPGQSYERNPIITNRTDVLRTDVCAARQQQGTGIGEVMIMMEKEI